MAEIIKRKPGRPRKTVSVPPVTPTDKKSRRRTADLNAEIAPDSLAARVLLLMRQRGLSAKSLSIRAGLSSDGVRALLRGRVQSPRAQSLVQLAAALGLSVDDLTSGSLRIPEAVSGAAALAADVTEIDVPEVDLRPRGQLHLEAAIRHHPRRRTWRLPLDLLDERGLPTSGLAIVRVASGGVDGYSPTDRLLVDAEARKPSGGVGTYVVHDGEVHALARLLPQGRGAITLQAEGGGAIEGEVVGRVLGRWTWAD